MVRTRLRTSLTSAMLAILAGPLASTGAVAQVRLDRADPTITEKALPQSVGEPAIAAPVPAAVSSPDSRAAPLPSRPVTAVTVQGAQPVQPSAFAGVIAPVVGRSLSRADLAELASAIAGVVRQQGFPFATAMVPAQDLRDGILRVTVDPGRIDAVRVVGATNAAADALLVRTLVSPGPVRQADLERALLLTADLPGVRVTGSRFVRQNGFGILLVTIEQDNAAAYAQVDNRGNREVGPVRSTVLGSVRGIAADGDELGLILAQTPTNPGEFNFVRARYGATLDRAGTVVAVSGSFGRSNPGASLARLDVVGHSVDAALSLSRPLLRRRARSLWAGLELRALSVQQFIGDIRFRDDRLATLTASLNGTALAGGGTLRGEVAGVAGLPLANATREGDARTSRVDGDARFAAVTMFVEWTRSLVGPLSLAISSTGQLASRPLLATAEIGLGGPSFGRGYDYAERTGDQGIMGSAELRADAGRLLPGVVDRMQGYIFADGGTVGNLRRGTGGGTLASAGLGVRGGTGRLDGMIELAFPLNEDRFDTGSKRPRLSLRLSRSF